MHAVFAVGVAEGAIEELVEMATRGRKQLFARASMKDSTVFQYELGRLDAELAAARALLDERTQLQWSRAQDSSIFRPETMAISMQAGCWVTDAGIKVCEGAYRLGGGTALYDSSPLQRRMRDLLAAGQHAVVQQQNYQGLGAARLGIGTGRA
jgi:alkylation response protein AidB-like acyl-CoA dehydrogenase